MSPRFLPNDKRNRRHIYSIPNRKELQSVLTAIGHIFPSDFSNSSVGKFRLRELLANTVSMFRVPVFCIFLVSAKEEMHGPDAIPNVAFMAHMKTFWDGPAMKLPRNAMRFLDSINPASTVTSSVLAADPKPTGMSLLDVVIKALTNWDLLRHLGYARFYQTEGFYAAI